MKNITESLFMLAYILPAAGCICYGFLLIFRKDSKPKRFLGILLLMASMGFVLDMIKETVALQNGESIPIAENWRVVMRMFCSPVIAWYLALTIRPDIKFYPHYLLLFLPFAVGASGMLIFEFLGITTPIVYTLPEFISLLPNHPEAIFLVFLEIVFIAQVIYIAYDTELLLRAHQILLKNDFSYTGKVDLRWIRPILIVIVGTAVLNMICAYTSSVQMRMILSVIFFLFIIVLGVLGGTQPDIYYIPQSAINPKQYLKKFRSTAIFISPIQDRVKISGFLYEKIRQGLIDLFENQEVYCKPELRLDDLAEMLNTNKTYVSYVLNEHFQTNFYTLVNRYRIRKAVILLKDPYLQIKDVWTLSGFNSQSSFNSLFKKEIGLTPSGWVRKNRRHHS